MAPAGPVYSPKRNIQGLKWVLHMCGQFGLWVGKNNQIETVFKSDMRLTMNNYETYVTFDEPNPASVNI